MKIAQILKVDVLNNRFHGRWSNLDFQDSKVEGGNQLFPSPQGSFSDILQIFSHAMETACYKYLRNILTIVASKSFYMRHSTTGK